MLAVLDALADVECDLIRTSAAEGRSRAKARGQHMGRPRNSPTRRRRRLAAVTRVDPSTWLRWRDVKSLFDSYRFLSQF